MASKAMVGSNPDTRCKMAMVHLKALTQDILPKEAWVIHFIQPHLNSV